MYALLTSLSSSPCVQYPTGVEYGDLFDYYEGATPSATDEYSEPQVNNAGNVWCVYVNHEVATPPFIVLFTVYYIGKSMWCGLTGVWVCQVVPQWFLGGVLWCWQVIEQFRTPCTTVNVCLRRLYGCMLDFYSFFNCSDLHYSSNVCGR